VSTNFLLVLKGSVSIGSELKTIHEAFYTLVLSSENDQSGVAVSTIEKGTELVIIAGEPLDQTVFQYGPFVMTNKQEIINTLEDCEQMYKSSMYIHADIGYRSGG
jgi:quercetin 2,3-dioxygenase